MPDEGARQGLIGAGLPDSLAGQVVEVFEMLRRGAGERVTATVESLTGSPPRDFASFARDYAHLFAPVAVGARR